ncbi:MAG: GatB/YqeY domain-containing protein [Candidatus Auribacterota bacterium]|jgi:uncharacterized protein YqeY|nr:GatB/YqeY domain-containing protein [Candidatus Auribacterota bacterium]
MTIKEQIQNDTKIAMKEKNQFKVGVLRMVFSEIRRFEIDNKIDITDDETIKIIKRGIKSREEAVVLYKKGERGELVQKEQDEIDILTQYLPAQLSVNELEQIIDAIITEKKLSQAKDMGIVMREVMSEYGSRTDGKTVQEIVRVKLRG